MFKLETGHTTTTNHFDHMRRSDSNRQKLIHKAKMKSLRISVVIVAGCNLKLFKVSLEVDKTFQSLFQSLFVGFHTSR